MNDEETAKATALAISKFSDLINKLAGPMAEEFGIMLADKVRVYRVRNWIRPSRRRSVYSERLDYPPMPSHPDCCCPSWKHRRSKTTRSYRICGPVCWQLRHGTPMPSLLRLLKLSNN
jgi:hypothetical protein